jgi:hypothetical protein
MSFPLNPVNGAKTIVNGIKYTYTSSSNSWRRDFNNALDRLFLVGGNQAFNTGTGDLVVLGGGAFTKNLIVGGDVIVSGSFLGTLTGTITTASEAISVRGGTAGAIVYQTNTSTTGFIPISNAGSILLSDGFKPIWTATAAINVAYATSATNIAGGLAWQIPFQLAPNSTTFSSSLTYNTVTLTVGNPTTSFSTLTGALVVTGGVGVGGNVNIGGNLKIAGDFEVDGTTTFINSTNLEISDLNITVANGATTATQADGAGITVAGPAVPAQIYYSANNDSWNVNKIFNIPIARITSGQVSTSSISGALTVNGGIGVVGDIYANLVYASLNGSVGIITPNTGAFTSVSANGVVIINNGSAAINTGTGALRVQGGVGIGGDLYVGGQIVGTATNALLANRAISTDIATTATLAYFANTATTARITTTATNIANGLATLIPFQSTTGTTVFSTNLAFDNTTFRTSSIVVTSSTNAITTSATNGLELINLNVNQSPAIRLAGSANATIIASSLGALTVWAEGAFNTPIIRMGLSGVNIPLIAASTSSITGALTIVGGVGVGLNLNVGGSVSIGSTSTIAGDFLPTRNEVYNLGSPTAKWKSLYVSTTTIFLGGTSMSVSPGGSLSVNGNVVAPSNFVTFGEGAGGMSGTEYLSTGFVGSQGGGQPSYLRCWYVTTQAGQAINACTTGTVLTAYQNDPNVYSTFVVTGRPIDDGQSNPFVDPTLRDYRIPVQPGVAGPQYFYAITFPRLVPTSSTSTGIVGQIAFDSTYVYMCVATNTWRRWAASTF